MELSSEEPTRAHRTDGEHNLQCACVRWFRLTHPDLALRLFAVPNGGRREYKVAVKMRAEGVVPGVSDLILLRKSEDYGALLIEMKTAQGRQSQRQREWEKAVTSNSDYRYVICRSLDDFIKEVEEYLSK